MKKKLDFKSMASIESQLFKNSWLNASSQIKGLRYKKEHNYLVMSNVFKSLVSGSDSTFLEK